MLLNCIFEREILNRTYLCGVGIQNVYVMPDKTIKVCSRYPWLETKTNIDNFDLFQFLKKYNKLISNVCLFENKFFEEFWNKKENPKYF